ncbi:MAG: glycosyltransferase, partial [Phycisphaerales bacterium JB059]
MPAPALLILPQGLTVTGVTTWALRLAGALAEGARPVGVVVHGAAPGHRALDATVPPGVRLFRDDTLPEIGATGGNLAPFVAFYQHAIEQISPERPVALIPTRHGDCFGACAALTRQCPDRVRVIGWQHLDSSYENAVLARYEPSFARMTGVSEHIAALLRARFPERAGHIRAVANGIGAPNDPPRRAPIEGRPLELIYTGRLEHEQKRVLALVEMSRHLATMNIPHRLTLVGDGPALGRLEAIAADSPALRVIPGVGPDAVTPLLEQSDVFLLASRREGMSVSLLEAMARGCAPVITRTASGAGEVIDTPACGRLIDFDERTTDARLARRLAEGVASVARDGVHEIGGRAWRRVRDHFSLERQAARAGALIDEAIESPPRSWPAQLDPAFATGAPGSGTVPADDPDRIRLVLDELASAP